MSLNNKEHRAYSNSKIYEREIAKKTIFILHLESDEEPGQVFSGRNNTIFTKA